MRKTAFFLIPIYFFLSLFMTAQAEGHLLEHAHHTRHAHHSFLHASLLCDWFCAASTHLDSTDPEPDRDVCPSLASPIPPVDRFVARLPFHKFYIRPPPIAPSSRN
ncbi:MAG: hypothetical protein WAO55_06455 [Candidatus Manganitrophaceae bacterium]